MVKIKSKKIWNDAINKFGSEPKTPEDWEKVTAIYRKLGGKITVRRSEGLGKFINGTTEKYSENLQEGFMDSLKTFLLKWISNPIVLGIALYFIGSKLKKMISKK